MKRTGHRKLNRYQKLRAEMCPGCPLFATCPQFDEQLDACADAAALVQEEDEGSAEALGFVILGLEETDE